MRTAARREKATLVEQRRLRRQAHEMIRLGGAWCCLASAPRCGYQTADVVSMLAHVTGAQQDLRHLPPLAWPGPTEEVA